tara:strand:+ start:780 stop:1046 length:267 start_codon:yes stop_codon:yes gene_type:complete
MPEVRLTLEEYEALLKAAEDFRGTGRFPSPERVKREMKPRKRKGKKDPKMARALKKANAIGRTKSGKLRKGYTQARIMKKAHQLRRKM